MKNTTFKSGSESQINKVSQGRETINQRTKIYSTSDGDSTIKTVSLSMTGENLGGLTSEVMMQNFEQMGSQGNAAMEQLRIGMSEDSNLDAIVNSTFTSKDNAESFSMSSTMTTNEQEAEMTTNTEEDTSVIRVDDYRTDAFTDTFMMEFGTISSFDN